MGMFLASIIAIILIALMVRDFRQGIIIAFLANTFLIPGSADVVGGIRFKFVILGAMIFVVFYRHLLKKINAKKILIPPKFYFIYSLLLAYFAVSVPFSTQLLYLVKMWIAYFGFGILLWYALESEKYVKMYENYFFVLISVLCILGIIEYLTSTNIFKLLFPSEVQFFDDERGGLHGRISSACGHPLDWGQSCVILFGMAPLLFNGISRYKIFMLVTLIGINCFFTGSRSCLFPLLLLAFFYLIFQSTTLVRKHYGKLTIGLFVLVFLIGSIRPEYISTAKAFLMPWDSDKSLDAGFNGSSVELREEQLENSIAFVGSRGLLVGMGYGLVHNRPEDDGDLFEHSFGLESIVFVTVIEQGIVGVLCLVIFFFLLFRMANRTTTEKRRKWMLLFLFIGYTLSLVMTGNRSTLPLFYSMLIVYMRHEQYNILYTNKE